MEAAPELPLSQQQAPVERKRRRLLYKQPDPEKALSETDEEPVALIQIPEDRRELRPLLKQLYHQLQKFRVRAWGALGPEDRRNPVSSLLLRSDMKIMSRKNKLKLVAAWEEEGGSWARSLAAVAKAWAAGELSTESLGQNEWKGTQGLFTWNGEFGLLDKEAILGNAWPPLGDVVAVLKMGDHLAELTAKVKERIAYWEMHHHLDKWCWALELCEERYEQARSRCRSPENCEDVSPGRSSHWSETSPELAALDEEPLRVHLHATLRFKHQVVKRKDLHLAFQDAFAVPAVACKQKKTPKDANFNELTGNAAFFYLQVTKISSIVSGANYLPFKHYVVNTDWVVNMWQQGKVTAKTARAVIVQCKRNVPNLLANWERVQKERAAADLGDTVRAVKTHLAGAMMPCRTVPEVDAWEATFNEVKFRYDFLVLDGPSKMGKTLFCRSRSLGIEESLLEVDCAGADTPDLSSYEFGKHRMVLCDEGSAAMVLRYKKLFQASASFTRLCSSKTNCHAYDVWAHQVKFVITSNRWAKELREMAWEDSEWLWQNSVYVYVDRPLYMLQ